MAGLEPARCYPLAPETSASTNSATFAGPSVRLGSYMCHRRLRITSAWAGVMGEMRRFPCQGKELVTIAALLTGSGRSTIGRAVLRVCDGQAEDGTRLNSSHEWIFRMP